MNVNNLISKILQDPTPTTDAQSERFLAVALGYPTTWRVRRRILEDPQGFHLGQLAENRDMTVEKSSSDPLVGTGSGNISPKIIDVIYAGNPKKGVDRWYNHEAAIVAALTSTGDNPYQFKGGHLTKIIPKFQKGDEVEVKYGRQWYAAAITKRKEFPEGIKYSVQYTVDNSIQDKVRETSIRMAPASAKALELAVSLGLPEGWEAIRNGNKYIFTSPEGLLFRTKKAALDHIREASLDQDDPPWRTAGHELMDRRVRIEHSHTLSGKRSITVKQLGTIRGWIAETDCDRHGQPGYTSEETQKPASLFHVEFDDAPGHPYFKYLVESQDMEEAEIRKCLVEDDVSTRPKKRSRF